MLIYIMLYSSQKYVLKKEFTRSFVFSIFIYGFAQSNVLYVFLAYSYGFNVTIKVRF